MIDLAKRSLLALLLPLPLTACVDELEPDLGAVQQAMGPTLLCGVYPNPVPGSHDTPGVCAAPSPATVNQIGYVYAGTSIPYEYRTFQWSIVTNAHGGPSILSGCRPQTNHCTLHLSPACVDREYTVTVTVRDTRSIAVPPEQATAVALIPKVPGCTLACTAPPAVPPSPTITMGCQGRFWADWPAVPSVNRYTMQAQLRLFPWDTALTVFDTNGTGCKYQVAPTSPPWPTLLRLRMCNDCGCSDYGPPSSVVFDPTHACSA